MSLTAQNIMDRASTIIQDQTNTRWPASELLNWLNDGRRDMSVVRPDLFSTTGNVSLVAGVRQSLPSNAIRLLDIPRNVSGAAVTVVQRGVLDQFDPNWPKSTASATVKHFMFDERAPTKFWVYPPATTSAQVEATYQQAVTDYSASTTLAAAEEFFGSALVDYLCYRAFSKDAEYAGNAERAIAHFNQFTNSLKVGVAVSISAGPNVQNMGGTKQAPQG